MPDATATMTPTTTVLQTVTGQDVGAYAIATMQSGYDLLMAFSLLVVITLGLWLGARVLP